MRTHITQSVPKDSNKITIIWRVCYCSDLLVQSGVGRAMIAQEVVQNLAPM
jgi:hypothetical protein